MAWNLVAPNTWKNDRSDYVIEYDPDYSQYVIRSMDGNYTIPFDDIFNNPVFPADFSNTSVIGKHFRAEGVNTPGTPGFSFQGDINTGFYRISEDTVGFSAGGTKYGQFGVGYGGFTGNVIQLAFAQTNTQKSNLTNDYATTGLSCSITPKYINSKILILYFIGGAFCDSTNGGLKYKLYKNGSEIIGTYEDIHAYNNTGTSASKYSAMYYDTPNTLSSITYEPYFVRRSTGTAYAQYLSSYSNMILLEIQQ